MASLLAVTRGHRWMRPTVVLDRIATGWLILTSWPLHLNVLQYAADYLSVFGSHYRPAANAVRILALAMLLASGCGMVDMVLTMGGRTTWNLANVLAALATTIGLDLLLIPLWCSPRRHLPLLTRH